MFWQSALWWTKQVIFTVKGVEATTDQSAVERHHRGLSFKFKQGLVFKVLTCCNYQSLNWTEQLNVNTQIDNNKKWLVSCVLKGYQATEITISCVWMSASHVVHTRSTKTWQTEMLIFAFLPKLIKWNIKSNINFHKFMSPTGSVGFITSLYSWFLR